MDWVLLAAAIDRVPSATCNEHCGAQTSRRYVADPLFLLGQSSLLKTSLSHNVMIIFARALV